MTRNLFRGCLFGGALFAAGLSPDASAQSFNHILSRASTYAQAVVGDNIDLLEESNNPLGVGSFQYGSGDFFGFTSATATGNEFVHNRPSSDDFAYSSCGVLAIAYVTGDMTVEVSWDFGAWEFGQVLVGNYTDPANPVILLDSMGVQAGTMMLTFDEGQTIAMSMATAGSAPGGDSFGRIEIPIACPADLDGNGVLNIDDIDAFVNLFVAGCP